MSGERGYDAGGDPGLPRSVVSERRSVRFTGRLLFGLVLVTVGLLWTLDNLGLVEAGEVLRWWPLLLVAYGFVRVTGLDGIRRVVSGSLFLLAGGWMLLRELDVIHVSIFRMWPVFMIVLGFAMVWRSMRGAGSDRDASERSAYPRPFAFMGGVERNIDSDSLVGLEATAVMGGIEADLRGAKPRGRQVVAEVFAWWGGIDLIVPEDWRVVTEVTPIMGGVEDSTKVEGDEAAATLIVRGLVVMGGVEIRNTKTERAFKGVRVGVTDLGGRRSRRKHVRVDATGITITREDGPPAPEDQPPAGASVPPPGGGSPPTA